jgi:hypothetical protein
MHLRYFLAASAASLSLATGLATPVMAQETTGTIRGTVFGENGPIAGATVELLNTATGSGATVASSANGSFSVSGLRAGDSYTVTVTAPGFARAEVTDVVTVAAQSYELPIKLAAEGGDVIVVTATRLRGARTVTQGPATVLGAEQISAIASVNRDVRDLARRDPFARLDYSPSTRAISFAGQNPKYNRFSVDGVAITDSFGLNADGLPSRRSPIPYDAIGQFQAKVAPYDVREGNFQGGAINIVLRSGKNEFQGTGFFAYSGDELTGKQTKAGPGVPDGRVTIPAFKYNNWGVELSGPIIKDKLFFMIAGERLRASEPIGEGPTDNNAGIAIPTLTQAQVDQVTAIAKSKYGYDTGGVLKSNGDIDDRLVARLDANLSDTQRASLTYMYAKDLINLVQNAATTSPFGLGLASNAYKQGNVLKTGVFQLNSDWSDALSSEVRGFYKDYVRVQDPLFGRGFAQMQVCTAPTSDISGGTANAINCPSTNAIVSFGPDVSRQTNELKVKTWGGMGQLRLKMNDHDLKMFGEYANVKVFNSFLQRSAGDYYFDSIADFQAGNAQRLRYGNAIPSLVPEAAASKFGYQSFTFGIQDTWRVSDLLSLSYGMRYDLYGGDSLPALNTTFVSRYGFANTKFVDGLGIFQPRIGFNLKPARTLSLRGGVGIFSGGTPDVYVSNSFSNTGVLTNTIDIRQLTGVVGSTATYNNAAGAAILSNVNGTTLPTAANTALTSATLSANSPTNSIAPNFRIPSQWRGTLSLDWTPERLGFLGSGWELGADVFWSGVRDQVYFTDLRVAANGTTTPDGRVRYSSRTSFDDTNTDILLTNSKVGRSIVGVVRARKTFDFGLETNFSYTRQSIKDNNPATSTTASSNYAAGVAFDANGPAYGIGNEQVRDNFKFDFTFTRAFFGDYKTTLALFGESRTGHTFSYTFRDTAARSTVFGTVNPGTTGGSRYLMYVPTGINDPKVSYASATMAQQIDDFINSSGLAKYRGMVAPRNAFTSKWVTRLDLHFSQELPTGVGKARFTVFADVENFTNLLNRNWGQIREYAFPYAIAPVTVQCLTTAVATGTAATGAAVATNSSQACTQYRYDANTKDSSGNFVAPTDTIYPRQSLYAIRVGARISF